MIESCFRAVAKRPEVYFVLRSTPAVPVPETVRERVPARWKGLRGQVEGEFRRFGRVSRGDDLSDARGERRVAR